MSSNSSAVSNIVIYYGGEGGSGQVVVTNEYGFTLIDNAGQLGSIPNPEEIKLVFIKNDGNSTDVAFWNDDLGQWDIRSLEGLKGEKGADGEDGYTPVKGVDYFDGEDGVGIKGEKGDAPAHEWQGTKLRFRNPDGSWGVFVNIKGLDGADGTDGLNGSDGEKGDKPAHQWNGTQLRFQNPDGTWGDYVTVKGEQGGAAEHEWVGTSIRFRNPDGTWGDFSDIQGEQGEQGIQGNAPDHEWNETSLRFKNPDGTWGTYSNLKGLKGDKPNHQISGSSVRFENPDGSWGDYFTLDSVRDIYHGSTPPIDESTGQENYSILWAKPNIITGFDFHVYDPETAQWVNLLGNADNVLTLGTFAVEQAEPFTLDLIRDTINALPYSISVGVSELPVLITYYEEVLYSIRLKDVGAGVYGLNGVPLDAANFYVSKTETLSLQGLIEIGSTNVIDLGDISGTTVWDALNASNPNETVQIIKDGFTAITTIEDTIARAYLFVGLPQDYGTTSGNTAVEADFKEIKVGRTNIIPTRTSDLLNDGEGTYPFISTQDKTELQGNIDTLDTNKEDKVNKVQNLDSPDTVTFPSSQAVVDYVQTHKDKNYIHNQGTADTVWTINHNLGKYPSVTVKDTAGNEVEGVVSQTDINNLTITFNSSFSGEATLN
jgi:hypothetical protein